MTDVETSSAQTDPSATTRLRFTVYVSDEEMGRVVCDRLAALCARRPISVEMDMVDVVAAPHLAEERNVVAVPMVVREAPPPRRRVIGMLDDERRCAEALGLDGYPRAEDG